MSRKPDGVLQFCLRNIPTALYNRAIVRTRFTDAANSKSQSFELDQEVTGPTSQDPFCFEYLVEHIEVPYEAVKVQVAFSVEGVQGPFAPNLTDAEIIQIGE